MHHKLSVFLLVLVLSIAAVLPAAAAPCAFGAAYDPACDVDQDGDIDVFDIQLTAGHWNQTGTWTGGGDGWLLTGNAGTNPTTNFIGTTDGQPLVMQPVGGNVGIGTSAPGARFNVVGTSWFQGDSTPLPAAAGKGIAIGFTGEQGYIYGFDYATWTHKNLIVQHAGGKVVIGSSTPAAGKLTVVGGASEHGVHVVSSANTDGVYVGSAGRNGLTVVSAGYNGLVVVSAPIIGLVVESAGVHGIDVAGNAYAGVFHGNINVTGSCSGCLLANFAVNAGERTLQPGDVVSIQAVTPTDFDSGPTLWQVTQAQPDQAVVGVVAGRAELVTEEDHRPTETGKRLVPREGAAQPDEYVSVVYSGPMQVKVAPGESAIAAGTRLTVAANGSVRPLQTRTVDGMIVTEGAPVIGVALEAPDKDGLVWVLVNPQ
ncbi:MAG: hypothetical protein WBD79_02225 [Anaerolineae bacterium]